MRPFHPWTTIIWSIWVVLFLTSKADDEDCTVELKVRRNTIYKATLGEQLRIDCPFKLCNNSLPKINWYKLSEKRVLLNVGNPTHFKTRWEKSNLHEGKYYLIFLSIGWSDFGEYQCESEGSVSHTIYINDTVGNKVANNSEDTKKTEKNDPPKPGSMDSFFLYVYSAAGIGLFVIIVITISVICMQGCKGKSKTEKRKVNKYKEIPLAEQALQHGTGLQPSPRGSPNPPPPRRPSARKTPRQSGELKTSRHNDQPNGQRIPGGNRTQVEEPAVVYAALKHGGPTREAPRPQRQIEETEYAAIRLV